MAEGRRAVAAAHEAFVLDNEVVAESEMGQLEASWHEERAGHVEEFWQSPTAMERLRDLDVANRILSNIGLPEVQGGMAATEAYQEGFDGAIERGASISRAVLEGAWAAAGAAAGAGLAPSQTGPANSAVYDTMIESGMSENAAWVVAESAVAPEMVSGTMRAAGLEEEWNQRVEALQQEIGSNEAASGMVETMKSHLRDGQMEQFGQIARGLGSMYQSGRLVATPPPTASFTAPTPAGTPTGGPDVGGGSEVSSPQEIPASVEERAETIYQGAISHGVPQDTAWVVSREAAGIEMSGDEAKRRQEGMRAELSGSSEAVTLARNVVQHLEQGEDNVAADAMDDLAAVYRDGGTTGA